MALRSEDTIRCLVMTDNHVGYLERDAVRCDDSFRAFEEMLQLARDEKVDCILHGGDLFHHNKPSRKTLHRTMELLRTYCLGERPVELELLTDAKDNFTLPTLNYMDPNLNVDIPIFAIHGNHDDPSGDGAFSAIDLLAQAGLVNYFGKHQQVDDLCVRPVLLRKGKSYLALYGLGNVRDERLYRSFAEKRVQMLQPDVGEELEEDLFSVMLIHQNRAQHTAKGHVSELMLPEFLDFIIWGHEHECLAEPHQTAGRDFYVSQPGSSVATSLVEGESKEKKALILEINRGQFQARAVELKTVRPFVIEDISMAIERVPKNDVEAMHKSLANRVKSMIERAREMNPDMLPLVRLRVEITEDYEKIPPQRFGAEFVDQVANAEDLLLYVRKKSRPDVNAGNARSESSILAARARDVASAKQTVEQEVSRILSSRAKHMSVLPETQLAVALTNFVEKEDNQAFASFLQNSFKATKAHIVSKMAEDGITEVTIDVIKAMAEMHVKEQDERAISHYDATAMNFDLGGDGDGADNKDDDDHDDDDVVAAKKPAPKKKAVVKPEPGIKAAAATKRKAPALKKKELNLVDDDDDDFDSGAPPKKSSAAPAAVKRERRPGRVQVDDDDDNGDDDEEDEAPKKKTAPKSTAGRSNATAVKRSPAKKQATLTAYVSSVVIDDDELSKPLWKK